MTIILRMSSLLLFSLLLLKGGDDSTLPRTSGIKMTVRYSSIANETEMTTYFRGDARRQETSNVTDSRYGPRLAFIERCDLGQIFELNLDQRQYDSYPYPPPLPTKEQMAKWGPKEQEYVPPGPPTSRIEVTTKDTGERTDFFGHQARHVIVTSKETPLAGSHRYAQESVTEGWYIDLKTDISCEPWWRTRERQKGFSYLSAGNAPERVEFVSIGTPEAGCEVESKTTVKSLYVSNDGKTREEVSKSRVKVLDFAEGPVDPANFEVPAGFKKVQRISRSEPQGERSSLSVGWQHFVLTLEDVVN
ncbi:MAG: hypothetical protein ABSH39_05475 [Candidatus Acidiferrum sp.]